MDGGTNPDRGRRSIVAAYCAEFEKVAATLADLLDVARRGVADVHDEDVAALRALQPLLERLDSHLEALADGGTSPPAPQPRTLANLFDGTGRDLARWSQPAVQASVQRMLATAEGGAGDEFRYELRSGPGNFRGLDDDGEEESPRPVRAESCPESDPEPERQPEPEPLPPEQLFDRLLEALSGRATLQGTSSSLPIPALFELISGSAKSGVLHLRTPREYLRFEFAGGLVVGTSTDAPPPGQRLGDLVVELGFVDRERRAAAVRKAMDEERPLGAVLVADGAISIEQLTSALQAQVQSRFDRVFREELVAYAFVPDERDDGDGRLRMNARQLFLQSARQADEDAWPPPNGS